jgi:hypothetical protein
MLYDGPTAVPWTSIHSAHVRCLERQVALPGSKPNERGEPHPQSSKRRAS